MTEPVNIPPAVRKAVLNRIEKFGVGPVQLGEELLMREGCGSFDDFVSNIRNRYGSDEADRVDEDMKELARRDAQTLQLGGRHPLDEAYRARVLAQNLTRYALIAAPDAEFVNGVELGLALVAQRHAEPGSARGSEAQDELGAAIDELFVRRAVPYRYELGKFAWAGDQGAHEVVVEPVLHVLADHRLAGARAEFEAALAHLRAGTQKDLEDAIDEAAKSVESALKVLAKETVTAVAENATIKPLFDALAAAGHIPAYTDNLVQGAARIRNKRGGHGAGAEPRQIQLDEATAAVHGAAAALTFLASRLP